MFELETFLPSSGSQPLLKVGLQRYLKMVARYSTSCSGGVKRRFDEWTEKTLRPQLAAWSRFVSSHPEQEVEARRMVDQALFHLDTQGATREGSDLRAMLYSACSILESGLEQLQLDSRLSWSPKHQAQAIVTFEQLPLINLPASQVPPPRWWSSAPLYGQDAEAVLTLDFLKTEQIPGFQFAISQEVGHVRTYEPSHNAAA